MQRCIGSHTGRYLKEFIALEKKQPHELNNLAEERLGRLLDYSSRIIPFYKENAKFTGNPALTDFPIMEKDTIKKHFFDLMTPSLKKEYINKKQKRFSYSWVEVKTGGSTGIPTAVIHDTHFRDHGRAARLYSQHLCGFSYGKPYYRLWGSMRDINQMKDSLPQRIMHWLSREELFNAFQMSDKSIEYYLRKINHGKIDHLMTYVDAAYHMALYAKRNQIQIRPLKTLMACAGTVTDDIRNTLQDVFKARVHNKYGSRDCADMACECEKGGLHIYNNNVFIEIVDVNGNPCPPGKIGRILVTCLHSHAFPLIRYAIGDMAALNGNRCDCGRPFPLLEKLEGRRIEFLLSNDGGFVSPVYIRHLIGVVHNPGYIKRFQLIQNGLEEYDLLLEIEKETSDVSLKENFSVIIRDLKAVLGDKSRINLRRVSELMPTESGKFLYTINKLKS